MIIDWAEFDKNPNMKYKKAGRKRVASFLVVKTSLISSVFPVLLNIKTGNKLMKNIAEATNNGSCQPEISAKYPPIGGEIVPPTIQSRLMRPNTVASLACADADEINVILAGPANASATP